MNLFEIIWVALYLRVSSIGQAKKEKSIPDQLADLKRYCADNNFKIYKVYVDDGITGTDVVEREDFLRMFDDAKEKKFSFVISWKADRLSRHTADGLYYIYRKLIPYGVNFISITDGIDTTKPYSEMQVASTFINAANEVKSIKLNTMRGRKSAARDGKWVTNWTPFGYKKDENKRLIVDKEKAALYRRIVGWYLKGTGVFQIAKKLNALGIPCQQSTARKKFSWRPGTIHKILKRPNYHTGEFQLWESIIKAPPLIPKSIWIRVQMQVKANDDGANRFTRRFYLLRGLIVCDKCHRNFWGYIIPSRKLRRYICASYQANPEPRNCGTRPINIDKLDFYVWKTMVDLIKNAKLLTQHIEKSKMTQKKDIITLEAQKVYIEKQIAEKNRQKDAILGLYGRMKNISDQELDKHIGQINSDRGLIEIDLAKIDENIKSLQEAEVQTKTTEDWAAKMAPRLERLDSQQKRELLLKLVRRVIVRWNAEEKSHYVSIEPRLPTVDNILMEKKMEPHVMLNLPYHDKDDSTYQWVRVPKD